jgi:hypothetical protein
MRQATDWEFLDEYYIMLNEGLHVFYGVGHEINKQWECCYCGMRLFATAQSLYGIMGDYKDRCFLRETSTGRMRQYDRSRYADNGLKHKNYGKQGTRQRIDKCQNPKKKKQKP